MSVRRIVVALVVIVVLVVGGYWAYQQYLAPQNEEPDVPVADVNATAVDTGVDVVSAEGQIVPLRNAALSFQSGGQVAEILVEEGATVEAGDPLIRLESTDLEIGLRQAEAGLAQAEASLEAANASLLAAREGVATAEIGVTTAEIGVTTAEIGVTTAEAQLALVQADPLPEEIASVESSIDAAEAGINQAAANRDLTLEIPESQIRAAEAQVAAAIAEQRVLQEQYDTITRYEVGGPPEEQTRFALNAATASQNAAQAALDELNEGATEAQRRSANSAVAVALAQRDSAQAQLDLLLAGVRPEQVTVSETAVAQAEAAVTQAQATVAQTEAAVAQAEAAVTQAEAAVAQAEAGLNQAEAARDAAQAALDKMTLTAPFDGALVDLSVELGEVVAPGVPVATLVDFSEWYVETTDLTELDVVAIAVDFPVDVRVDAIPDETLKGTVIDIAAVSSLTRGDVTYAVTIRLEDVAGLPLRWGMTVFVDVVVD